MAATTTSQAQPFTRLPTDDRVQKDVYDKLEIVLSQLNSANASIVSLTARVAALESAP